MTVNCIDESKTKLEQLVLTVAAGTSENNNSTDEMHATRQQGTHKTFEDIPDDLMFKFSHLHMKARLRAKSVKESFAISFTCRRQCRSKRQKGAISFLRNRIENVNKRDTRSSLLFCPADITERCIFIFILEKCDLSALKSISLRVQAPSRGIVEHVKD
jgi:hypothetical protein